MLLIDGGRHRSDPPRPPLLVLGGVFIAIMAWDGLTSYAGLRQTTNEIRLATGLLTGWSLPLMVLPLLNSSLWRSVRPGRVLDGLREVAMWLLALPVAFAVMWWRFAPAGLAYALLVAASIVITFTSVNLIIVGLVPAFEHRYDRLRAMWPAVAVALTLALVEIAGSAWLRLWVQSLVSVR
jgi:hypothetical protein